VDIRWCTHCYEPVRELSQRAPIHDGDFVDRPIHERGRIPRWSRWEKTATTFGPWGRIAATVLLFATLLPAIAFNGFVYAICFPVAATVLLREIWAKGWFVPQDPREAPVATMPDPAAAEGPRPQPIAMTRVLRWGGAIVGLVAFAYGPVEVKVSVIGLAAIALLAWFWTAFDSR